MAARPNGAPKSVSPRLRLIAFAALAGGLLLRTFGLLLNPDAPLVDCDGRASFVMGMAWAQGRGLYLDDPALLELCALFGLEELGPAHHFALGLALIEGSFFTLVGNATLALVVPLLLISWLAVAAVWWTTRNLYGGDAALLTSAAVSLEWTGILFGTWKGFSENLVVIALTLTIWAVLRALHDDRFMLAAGFFAGVGYISKASLGPIFLIAGLGGLVWRLLFRGRRVLLNGWYWGPSASSASFSSCGPCATSVSFGTGLRRACWARGRRARWSAEWWKRPSRNRESCWSAWPASCRSCSSAWRSLSSRCCRDLARQSADGERRSRSGYGSPCS